MLKYRGSQLIRAGFIGVVLIILVIAIGLQPERLISWATALRYQAMFTEAGGLTTGNDVTVSGIKVGSVSSVELVNGDALVGFTINGKYALGSDIDRAHPHRNPARRAGSGAGVGRQWHAGPQADHSDHADVVAVLIDGRGQRPDRQHGRHRHRHRSTSRWTRCRRRSTRSLRSWVRRSTASHGCRSRSTTATRVWLSC